MLDKLTKNNILYVELLFLVELMKQLKFLFPLNKCIGTGKELVLDVIMESNCKAD